MVTPLELASNRFKGKNVLIFGLGLLGGAIGDARFFAKIGSKVRVTDKKNESELAPSMAKLTDYPVSYSLGTENPADIDWADIIIRNPSIPENHFLLAEAKAKHKEVLMRTSLFIELAHIDIIGITGTRGKTTTTQMIYELAKAFSPKKVLLGGNTAGMSDLELLEEIIEPKNTLGILELSSWQLQGIKQAKISPHVAVLTNLYPDHLNVYGDLDAYYGDKRAILEFQKKSDYALINASQQEFRDWVKQSPAIIKSFSYQDIPASVQLRVPGIHNRANAAAALKVADIMGWPLDKSLKVLQAYKGVPYRLETVAIKEGITYINDTTSTTPIAALVALKAMEVAPILICGGNDKNLPLDDLAANIGKRTKAIVLLPGTGTEKLKSLLQGHEKYREVATMSEAVQTAHDLASHGDIILLSPGFTSFGLFNNEFDRGDKFNLCVNATK